MPFPFQQLLIIILFAFSWEYGNSAITVSECGKYAFICSSSSFSQQPLVPDCIVASGGFCCCNWDYVPGGSTCGCQIPNKGSSAPVYQPTSPPSLKPKSSSPSKKPSKLPTAPPTRFQSVSPTKKPPTPRPTSRIPSSKPSTIIPTPKVPTPKPSNAPKSVLPTPSKPSNSPSIAPPTQSPPPVSTVVTTGVINFHYYYGSFNSATMESMTLDGDAYTSLIMSNLVAGVLLGHLIRKTNANFPFNEDYLYGSIFGQLLQENIATQLFRADTALLAPSPQQAAVFGVGQGGPYQINNYVPDMVSGTYSPLGFALLNYVALQKNIGYTFSTSVAQAASSTPASFNNLYFGPLLTTYFHFNDFMSLQYIGGASLTQPWTPSSHSWTPSFQPNLYNCISALQSLSNSPLDVILNVAYNQGFYGSLFAADVAACKSTTASNVDANFNSFAKSAGDSYSQYPYQVRGYIDQLFGRTTPSPADINVNLPPSKNHVAIPMSTMGSIFAAVFATVGYVNPSTKVYSLIPSATALNAFQGALTTVSVAAGATLDLCVAAQRETLFTVLENAIAALEVALGGIDFSAKSDKQL